MFTNKDIEQKTIFVINSLEKRALRVESGELILVDTSDNKTLTKLPFQKILVLFVIGHTSITTPLIDKCSQWGIPLVVMKPNLRPVFFYSLTAEANFLLRKRQFELNKDDLQIPKIIVSNKIQNQLRLLEKTRLKSELILKARILFPQAINSVLNADSYDVIMGTEGRIAKHFFSAYYENFEWKGRYPRVKSDVMNVTLDIGYTILFNFIEAYIRLFGFDPYIGVYHRLWFRRKSLVCDLMEPFRCLIDQQVRKAFNTKQCKKEDFILLKNEYHLKHENNSRYTRMFFEALIAEKIEIFQFIRDYYRCFMQRKSTPDYPKYVLK